MSKTTLYELAQNYNNLYDLILDDEIPVEIIEDGLKEIEDSIEIKFENIAKFIKSLEGNIAMFKEEEKRLAARRKTMENKVKSLKDYMLVQLTVMERNKIDANTFTIRKQRNNPAAQIYDAKQLPEKYLIPQEPKVDSKMVLDDLKAGKEIKGAGLKPESYHVRIR